MSRWTRTRYLAATMALWVSLGACGDDGSTDDECEDATCTTPPADFCDGDQLVTYAATGTCVDDACSYEATTAECADGCADAACIEGADE